MKYFNAPLLVTICALAPIVIIPQKADAKTYAGCANVAEKIEKTQQKMRLGYTAKQGEKLKTRLRYLKKQRNKCERHAEKIAQTLSQNNSLLTHTQSLVVDGKQGHKQQNKVKKTTKQYQDYSHYQVKTNWSYSQASDERKAHWDKQQAIENKRITELNERYSHAIKDAKEDNDN